MRHDLLRRAVVPCLLAAVAACAVAGEAPLTLTGTAAYYGLQVPLEVLAQTRSAELSDIQVLNARGEPVPHAWADAPQPGTSQVQRRSVPFFKAPAAASAVDASQQGGWILDTRDVKGALIELQLGVAAGTQGIYGFVLEHSHDLQSWRTLRASAQLLALQHQGLRLENNRFDLGGLRAGYLRLRPLPGSQVPPLTAAVVASTTHYTPAPPLQWSDPIAPTACTAQHCDYTLPRHLPLERLEWQLGEANTLAPVNLLVHLDTPDNSDSATSSVVRPHRHPIRDHLRGLRRKTAPTATPAQDTWYPLQSTTAYWLRLPEGEVRSPELLLNAGLVTRLRVQPAGGMVQLGTKPPTIRIGAHAASLVFLAREPAPYRLAWGGADATSALTLAQLMPTRRPDDALPTNTASVQLSPLPAVGAAAPPPLAASTVPATAAESRKVWLWVALLAALALMGAMAWSLLRPGRGPAKPD